MRDIHPDTCTRRHVLATTALGVAGTLLAGRTRAQEPHPGWVRNPEGPVLSLGPKGSFDGFNIFSPCAVKENGRYFLYYSGGPTGPDDGGYVNHQLGIALSDDGAHFQKTGKPIFPLTSRMNFQCTPAVLRTPDTRLLKVNGLWHMIFCANRRNEVFHATSPDGLDWTLDERNPIFPNAYAPCLLKVGNEYRMYYTYGGVRPWEIHLATGPDIYSLKPHPDNPMLILDQHDWEATDEVGTSALVYPYVWLEDETWIMYYASYWKSGWGHQTTAMGMAKSATGLAWTKHPDNPVFKPTRGSNYDGAYVSSQCIIRDGDGYRMYYGARIDTIHRYYAIGMATWQGKMLRTPSPSGRGLG
ncbi:hypothetical protein HS125_01030 [bacterium]|nr:hypothetical protein [bacterium]